MRQKSVTGYQVLDARQMQILEDDTNLAEILAKSARSIGYEVIIISEQSSWQANRQRPPPAVLILDLNLGFASGIECLEQMLAAGFCGQVILISGCDDRVFRFSERICRELGAQVAASLNKPFSTTSFLAVLKPLLQNCQGAEHGDLARALADGQFVPYLQPIVDLDHLTVTDVEVLARWQHPTGGVLPPSQFINSMEQEGLMPTLTLSMLDQAIAATKALAQSDNPHLAPNLGLSVNVSPSTLLDPDFSLRFLDTISAAGGSAERIKIEITEAVAFAGIERIRRVLTRLRIAGIGISIDDFGTGYSSFTALHELPFSGLKIDRSFILRMLTDPEADTIVRSIIKLAHNLGLQVVGEGIENEQTLAALKRRHCDRGQGFHIAKPMSADRLDHWQLAPGSAEQTA
ncbi:MAG: EAL domain-containing response regulator [Pseudomonadota bacterium]